MVFLNVSCPEAVRMSACAEAVVGCQFGLDVNAEFVTVHGQYGTRCSTTAKKSAINITSL